MIDSDKEIATLAGGCFWCLEAVYNDLKGVESVESGYMGGKTANPGYEDVCSGETGHAEVVQLSFDPKSVSFKEILEVFFVIHDPTTLNRQGNDAGTQYRSAIFYHSAAQKACRRQNSMRRRSTTRNTSGAIPPSPTALSSSDRKSQNSGSTSWKS